VESLTAGVERARDIIATGKALAKLRDWVGAQNTNPDEGLAKLERRMKAAYAR